MSLSPRIKKKILQYSLISKAVGIIDEDEYNQILRNLASEEQHFFEKE
ncbi:hypothetical protein [Mesobacillus maritimus]|uniref:Fur-regulated basic protein FbpA n=1 Tax=Mesobacillus maritimus TaxID=1643336 RepID=A0ABS7KBI8_9BACI|nr:hypothetical protein [Mesobacillus maritimus]MBY0099634.1 hypothetical protein [Mesobacillus maritimus]